MQTPILDARDPLALPDTEEEATHTHTHTFALPVTLFAAARARDLNRRRPFLRLL